MLSYNEFAKVMQHIGLLHEQEDRINRIFLDPLYDGVQNDFASAYCFNNPVIEQDLVDVLQNMYNDKDAWISYYIYELDCGVLWTPGMIEDKDGKDIPLGCVKHLWNLLMENLNDN